MSRSTVMNGFTTVTLDLDIRQMLIAVLQDGGELHSLLKSEDDLRRRTGTDLYRNLAAWISKVKPEEVSHEQRHNAKAFLLAYLYGKEGCKAHLAALETKEISDFVMAVGNDLPGVACYTRHITERYTAGFTFVMENGSLTNTVRELLDVASSTLPHCFNIEYTRRDGSPIVISSAGGNAFPEEPA